MSVEPRHSGSTDGDYEWPPRLSTVDLLRLAARVLSTGRGQYGGF